MNFNRPSQTRTECKRFKPGKIMKSLVTTDPITRETKVLSMLKFEDIENTPPKIIEDFEKVDRVVIENLEIIKENTEKILQYSKKLEGFNIEEDEILSRICERSEALEKEIFKYEGLLKELNGKSKEIDEEIEAVKKDLERNKATFWNLECKNDAGNTRNNQLRGDINALGNEIEKSQILSEKYECEKKAIDSASQGKLKHLEKSKKSIQDLIVDCEELHKISLSDQESLAKLHEEISKFDNN